MYKPALLGPWVRRFLMKHLIGERNLSRNTQQSYRDTLTLLLPFTGRQQKKTVDHVTFAQRNAIAEFLAQFRETLGQRPDQRSQFLAAPGIDVPADLVIGYPARFLSDSWRMRMASRISFRTLVMIGTGVGLVRFIRVVICSAIARKHLPALIVGLRSGNLRASFQQIEIFRNYRDRMFATGVAHRAGAPRVESNALFRLRITPHCDRIAIAAGHSGQQPAIFRNGQVIDPALALIGPAARYRALPRPLHEIVPGQSCPA